MGFERPHIPFRVLDIASLTPTSPSLNDPGITLLSVMGLSPILDLMKPCDNEFKLTEPESVQGL